MARQIGALNYTKYQVNFIRRNWQIMSDESLCRETKIPLSSIQKIRNRFGLSRFKYKVSDNSTKAYVCELYTSEMPVKEIAGIVGKSITGVHDIISKCLFGFPLTEITEIRVFKSKI